MSVTMQILAYSTKKPVVPGWYWCRNKGDYPGQIWEAVVRIEQGGIIDAHGAHPSGLVCCWMKAPGEVGIMNESDWSEDCEWAGPIQPPGDESSS